MNSVQVMGNLARDPQIRATKTGRAVASFSIAVNRIRHLRVNREN